jgi:fructoselysine-6-P-deglycase FrlB-like protein
VSTPGSFVAGEITSQPECWRRAAELAGTGAVADALPEPGARVALVGCGTSLYMAQSCAALRESAGLGETDAFPASEFPATRRYDHLVALTRSGTTTEVLRLLDGLPAGRRSSVVTTARDLPVTRRASSTIVLDFADERSVVQTRFATTALALWRAHLGESLAGAISDAEAQVVAPPPHGPADRSHFIFLGTGWRVGLANEAALKCREAAQAWSESYPAMEFRHGPVSAVGTDSAVWLFGVAPDGLVGEIEQTGAAVMQAPDLDPMAHLIAAQRLAVALAERQGLDPDAPRNLTRAVVLGT